MFIEDLILEHDKRGVSALRPHLSPNFCEEAAQFILSNPGTTLIATGFYILRAKAPETDGPPGALALGRALESLGRQVVYVTDRYTMPLLRFLAGRAAEIADFPLAEDSASRRFAAELLTRFGPSLLIAIERCSLTRGGIYLNMRGMDISPYTAKVDYLFLQHPRTIGIGDGGNEIGMGNLAQFIPQVPSLPSNPATTPVTHLVIASVANWGAYGLLAALSRLVGRNVLPSIEEETALIRRAVNFGAVDGTTAESAYTVDGFSLEENAQLLERLHSLLAKEGISGQ